MPESISNRLDKIINATKVTDGHRPKAIYLGTDEMRLLKAEIEEATGVSQKKIQNFKYKNISVFKVYAVKHFNVL